MTFRTNFSRWVRKTTVFEPKEVEASDFSYPTVRVLQDVPVGPGLVEDRDPFLPEETVFKAVSCDEPGPFDAHLGQGPEVDVSQSGNAWG